MISCRMPGAGEVVTLERITAGSEAQVRARLLAAVAPLLEAAWEVSLSAVPVTGLAVAPQRRPESPLALRVGDGALILARPVWQTTGDALAAALTVEQLFSIYGVFELARTTLGQGIAPFGPVWCFLADRETFAPAPTVEIAPGDTVIELQPEALRQLSGATYWHCDPQSAAVGFALCDAPGGTIQALATVWRTPEILWEIGVDVLPAAQGRGWGRAAVSAAAAWVLDRAPLVYYTTGAFNIPSCRTARSLGFRHCWSVIKGLAGPFLIPPGPLGRPLPEVVPQPYWRSYPEPPEPESAPETATGQTRPLAPPGAPPPSADSR